MDTCENAHQVTMPAHYQLHGLADVPAPYAYSRPSYACSSFPPSGPQTVYVHPVAHKRVGPVYTSCLEHIPTCSIGRYCEPRTAHLQQQCEELQQLQREHERKNKSALAAILKAMLWGAAAASATLCSVAGGVFSCCFYGVYHRDLVQLPEDKPLAH